MLRFIFTGLSLLHLWVVRTVFFLRVLGICASLEVIVMRKKNLVFEMENDFPLDLTVHKVPASLLTEFAEKIVKPYFDGNLNAAVQDLMQKAIVEQDFVLSHVTHIRLSEKQPFR